MNGLTFELAKREHAGAIQRMRQESSFDLIDKLGHGPWGRFSRIGSVRERIDLGDPDALRHNTIYVACREGEAVGSVVVSTFPPGFWRRSYWREPGAGGLGVFYLVVFPNLQGQGIGRFVMEGVERLAADRRIAFVRLDAYSENHLSTGFYRHIGYEDRGEIDLRGIRLTLMEKRVSQ